MKKFISVFICLIIVIGVFAGCNNTVSSEKNKLSIVTTIFPEYDWVNQILGENKDKADVTMLLDNGVDLHSYQPTAEDLIKINSCDLFVYVGGESDEWVDDVLKNSVNNNVTVINLLDALGDKVKTEEIVEGMQEDDEHEHEDESDEHEEEHEHENEADEHVWLSLKNAEFFCNLIAEKLSVIDPESSEIYKKNASDYSKKLSDLDNQYKQLLDNVKTKTLLFGDRFPFRYLADDYNIKYYAAFVGCSAETEASFETISFLSKKVDELNLPCVIALEKSNHKIAQTIINNTKDKNQSVLVLDSMQSQSMKDVSDGVSYLSVMQSNLDVLKTAFK